MCKSIRETHQPKQVPTDAAEELEKETTRSRTSRKRPPKCADLVVANGRWSLTRIEPQEVSLRRKLNTSTLRRIIYCMQFPSYGMCSSMLLLFLPQEIRKLVGWSLKRGWKQYKIIKQSAPISGLGCLRERFHLEDLPGWVLVFWIGGRTWSFNCTPTE